MKAVITSKAGTKEALDRFRERLAALAESSEQIEWAFPNGEKGKFPTYTLGSVHGALQVGLPVRWSSRAPHLFRFYDDKSVVSPDVEINIPESVDRRVSGVYVHSAGATWLCSRGSFTAFRGRIPRETVFNHFEKWLVDVRDVNEVARVIPVASLDSPSMVDDIGAFLREIVDLKEDFKQGGNGSPDAYGGPGWHTGLEFEGVKTPITPKPPEEYDYAHGPLCNDLFRLLRATVRAERGEIAVKNKSLDSAVVVNDRARVIFEVKTAPDGPQIHSAVGQLFIYRQKYGTPSSRLALVLHEQHRNAGKALNELMKPLGIDLVFGAGKTFQCFDGSSLVQYLEQTGI